MKLGGSLSSYPACVLRNGDAYSLLVLRVPFRQIPLFAVYAVYARHVSDHVIFYSSIFWIEHLLMLFLTATWIVRLYPLHTVLLYFISITILLKSLFGHVNLTKNVPLKYDEAPFILSFVFYVPSIIFIDLKAK